MLNTSESFVTYTSLYIYIYIYMTCLMIIIMYICALYKYGMWLQVMMTYSTIMLGELSLGIPIYTTIISAPHRQDTSSLILTLILSSDDVPSDSLGNALSSQLAESAAGAGLTVGGIRRHGESSGTFFDLINVHGELYTTLHGMIISNHNEL